MIVTIPHIASFLFFYSSTFSLLSFGRIRLSSSDTTNTPATAFPLKISPTACGRELKKAPSGGNRDARIRIKAPIRIVNRLITPVMLSPGSIEQQPNSLLDSVCIFILSESAKHCLLDCTENVFITCAAAQMTGHHFTDLII